METNSLLLLYDDAQSIYRKTSGLGFTLSSVGVQAKCRSRPLSALPVAALYLDSLGSTGRGAAGRYRPRSRLYLFFSSAAWM